MKTTIIAMAILLATAANADEWTGPDKTKHAIGGAGIGGAVTLVTKSAAWGCAAATAVGAGKEFYDAAHRDTHTPSLKDFAVTAAAGCMVAGVTGLVITPRSVSYSVSLNLF